jgi:hypothetical protein
VPALQVLKLLLIAAVCLGVVIGTAYAMVPVMLFLGISLVVMFLYYLVKEDHDEKKKKTENKKGP